MDNKILQKNQETISDKVSVGPGLYRLNESLKQNTPAYPWAPGSYTTRESEGILPEEIDIESDLNNLSRPLTNDISKQYSPMDNKLVQKQLYSKDGFFNQSENTNLTNPAFNLKEFGINRWEYLPINPQSNVIEPFPREGINTVLQTLDAHGKCPS